MTVKQKRSLSAVIGAMILTAVIITALLLILNDKPQTNTISEAQEICYDTSSSVQASGNSYFLREYNGLIGVFREDGALYDVLNVPVVTLPSAERKQLSVGVYAADSKELAALVEDYTG